MLDDKGEKTEVPSIGISLNLQFAAGRTVVFQTHVSQDVNVEGLNTILDKLNYVGDRAEAFYAQDQAKRQLEVETKSMNNIIRRLTEVDDNMRMKAMAEGGRRNPKPSATDEMQKKQALDNLEESKRRVQECKDFLAELIKKAGNRDASASATDR